LPSDKFIILRAKVFAESDLILDVLNRQGEQLTLSAKNAVKSRRRFAGGVLEPLNYVEIQFTQSLKSPSHSYIQEARCLYSFQGLRTDYNKLEVALKMLKLVNKVTKEGLGDMPQIFDLLGNSLRCLETSQQAPLLFLHFKIKCFYYLGFFPVNEDSQEFIAQPVSQHENIQLTDEEFLHLNQWANQQLRELEVRLD
jgi:DNA repair protein RecO (recombination protein O)